MLLIQSGAVNLDRTEKTLSRMTANLGVFPSEMQDAAQHCDQFGSFTHVVGHEKLSEDVDEVLHIDFTGAGIEFSFSHKGHLEITYTRF